MLKGEGGPHDRRPFGRLPEPVRVGAVDFAVLVGPLRLEPGAVFQPLGAHVIGEGCDAVGELFGIALAPVADAVAEVAGEPAAVHAEILEAGCGGSVDRGPETLVGVVVGEGEPVIEGGRGQDLFAAQ